MGKRSGKITRQHKSALTKLTDEMRTAGEIGENEQCLMDLADHRLARAVLDLGEMRFRITEKGKSMISRLAVDA